MKISEITNYLEELAPLSSQESYDNSGFIVGDKNAELTQALISLDCTEEIVSEAISKKCNLIISHHPIVFKGLKKITGKTYIERVLIKAIQNNIAIYAIHTNLDNYKLGVNKKIGEKIGIENPAILSSQSGSLTKLITYVPSEVVGKVRDAIFSAGGGNIGNYSECSFNSEGIGTYMGNDQSNPVYGTKGIRSNEPETKLEVLISSHIISQVVSALKVAHPYEEVAFDLIEVTNTNEYEGAGMYGELNNPISEKDFLDQIKKSFGCKVIRHTNFLNKSIKRVAWCGGSGSFLLNAAKAKNADIFITGDFKYHDFFDAEDEIVIADIGHFESEQFTIELIAELITKKIPTFAPCLTEISTNPVKYY